MLKSALWTLERQLPEEIRLALLCRRRSGFWREAGAILIHVPKAAGTSVSRALYGRSLGHIPASAMMRHGRELFGSLPSFAILRDPAERAYSAWRFAASGGNALAGIDPAAHRAAADHGDFESFLTGWLERADLGRADPVFRPQSFYVCDGEGQPLVDRLFPIGRMDAVETWLAETTGRPIRIPELNRSGAPPALSDALRARVEALYPQDTVLYAASAQVAET